LSFLPPSYENPLLELSIVPGTQKELADRFSDFADPFDGDQFERVDDGVKRFPGFLLRFIDQIQALEISSRLQK